MSTDPDRICFLGLVPALRSCGCSSSLEMFTICSVRGTVALHDVSRVPSEEPAPNHLHMRCDLSRPRSFASMTLHALRRVLEICVLGVQLDLLHSVGKWIRITCPGFKLLAAYISLFKNQPWVKCEIA